MNVHLKKISAEMVCDYYENRLSPKHAAQVAAALTRDSESRELLAWLERSTSTLRETIRSRELAPSNEAVTAVQRMFRDRVREAHRVELPTLVARLVFDSRRALAPKVRGEGHLNFQVVYIADQHDVDLWQEQLEDGSWYVIGQILPKDGGDAVTPQRGALTQEGGVIAPLEARDGEFFLSSASEGRYDLRLELTDRQILVPDFIVGTTRD